MAKSRRSSARPSGLESHADELKQHAVAYFNSDGNGRGYFRAEGSHSLENFVNSVAKDIDDPETNMPVWKRARLVGISRATPESRAELRSRPDIRMEALGSGSDYTAFIHHLGVRQRQPGLWRRRPRRRPVSLHLRRLLLVLALPGHGLCLWKALAQTAGTMMMRMADADVIPFQFADLADTIRTYATERQEAARHHARRDQGAQHRDRRWRLQGVGGSEEDAGSASRSRRFHHI